MAGSDKSTKDKQMASRLKRLGIERTSGRCPTCYKVVSMRPHASISRALYSHIVTCRGRTRSV